MNNRTILWTIALAALAAAPVRAQAPAENGAPPGDAPSAHGDIRHFHLRDFSTWRTGRWVHDAHDGRFGWWWVVGNTWYPYSQVSYPYPDPYTPPPYTQPTVIDPAPTAPAPEPTPPMYWYYCESIGQFYPYAVTCPDGWVAVLSTRYREPR